MNRTQALKTQHPSQRALAGVILSFAIASLAGCKQPKTVPPSNTDIFTNSSVEAYAQANKVLRGDYLFVVDYSFSMYNKVRELANSLDDFADDLVGAAVDYRIGFIRGNFHGTASSNQVADWIPGNFITSSFIVPGTSSSLKSEIYDAVADVGDPLQQNRVVLFEAARKTLNAKGGEFLRPEAQLILVFVSDADDESEKYKSQLNFGGSVTDYANALKAFKGSSYINARAIVAGASAGCTPKYYWDVAGTKISQLAAAVDSGTPANPTTSCIYNTFSQNLADLAVNVTRPTDRFRLQMPPISGTLTVKVNGAVVPQAGNWTFNSSTNEVVFVPGHEPAFSASVTFEYEVAFVLTAQPNPSTIKVEVNGSAVNQDNSNGWSYIAAENRIVFNGSAKPPGGASIRVTYELQR